MGGWLQGGTRSSGQLGRNDVRTAPVARTAAGQGMPLSNVESYVHVYEAVPDLLTAAERLMDNARSASVSPSSLQQFQRSPRTCEGTDAEGRLVVREDRHDALATTAHHSHRPAQAARNPLRSKPRLLADTLGRHPQPNPYDLALALDRFETTMYLRARPWQGEAL